VRAAEIGRRYVDMLLKVWLKGGQEQWVMIHIEVQAGEDADFGLRMYIYNYRIFDRYNREVASFAILADDNPRWRPDSYGYARWGTQVGIKFPAVKLLDYVPRRTELEASLNPFATVVLAHLDTMQTRQDQHERKDRKFRLIKGLYERGWDREQIEQLLHLIDWMMELPEPLADEWWQEVQEFAKEKHMPFISTPERIGARRGLSQGLCRGIEATLKVKFGEPGLQLMPEIRQIKDNEKLEAILDAVGTAATPEELRRIWAG